MTQQVVIIGGGFGGLTAAKRLRRADALVTVIDRSNHHLFQPLLYQVATGGLSPAHIASPIRFVLRRHHNARVIEDTVTDISDSSVITESGEIPFDVLVVAAGARHDYFGNDEWEEFAPGLKTLPDATRVRTTILEAFETAERTGSDDLTFLVVGGGPTGVEMAGTIVEMAQYTLRHEFRDIDPARARVVLAEAGPRLLPTYPESLSIKASRQLATLGAEVRTGWRVTDIGDGTAVISNGDETETMTPAGIIWAAGVRASSLGVSLQRLGADLDRSGRVAVGPELTIPGHDNIYVIGDLAVATSRGRPVPGVAPAAMQMGRYVADRIMRRATRPFQYRNKGNLATIGRHAAVADFGRLRFGGFAAWAAWLGIHIFFLIGFQNRVLVMIQWGSSYITHNRSARLIVRYGDPGDR